MVVRTPAGGSFSVQSIRFPQMVNRSISNKSFLGVLSLSPSSSSPVSVLMTLSSSSSSGVVRNVSESLFRIVEEALSGLSVSREMPDAGDTPALSDVISVEENTLRDCEQVKFFGNHYYRQTNL